MNEQNPPSEHTSPTRPSSPSSLWHGSRRLQLLAMAALLAVALIVCALVLVGHGRRTAGSLAGQPTPTSSATPTTTASAVTSSTPPVTRPAVTKPSAKRTTMATAKPARPAAGPIATPVSGGQNSGGSGTGTSWPQPVTSSAAPVRATSHPTQAPRPRPTHTATPTPTAPAFVAHFIDAPQPAAFAGIPRGGAAQSAAEDCARYGNCGVTGVQWGGSCSLPAYRGDTAGAARSGWALWQRGPDDCTWAMAVSSF